MFPAAFHCVPDRETELRQLRKSNTDLEQQNAILEKHLENMKQAVDKLQIETLQRKTSNNLLQQHLQKMKNIFIEKFANIALPGNCRYSVRGPVQEGLLASALIIGHFIFLRYPRNAFCCEYRTIRF